MPRGSTLCATLPGSASRTSSQLAASLAESSVHWIAYALRASLASGWRCVARFPRCELPPPSWRVQVLWPDPRVVVSPYEGIGMAYRLARCFSVRAHVCVYMICARVASGGRSMRVGLFVHCGVVHDESWESVSAVGQS